MVNEDQLAAEADARALRDAEEVQDQTQASLDLMLASPFGMVPENEADAPMYAGEQATSMSLHSSVRDPYRPVVLWGSWIGRINDQKSLVPCRNIKNIIFSRNAL